MLFHYLCLDFSEIQIFLIYFPHFSFTEIVMKDTTTSLQIT